MNRDRHRLVFDVRRGMRVPVAEHVRAGRPARRRVRRAAFALFIAAGPALAGSLPVPAMTFVTRGRADAPVVSGTQMSIRQHSSVAVMNWQSFDIARGHGVEFLQPSNLARAINLIWGLDPSRIEGALKANGQVLLFNQNGILFGDGAQVNVGGLLASALALKENLYDKALSTYGANVAALDQAPGAPDAAVRVLAGARIVTAPNGRVFLAAPEVSNAGTIETPEGQTVLAAGRKVYLADPLDARLRGFIVEVDAGGAVSNEQLGRIVAERGNITLAGLAVRQDGVARATTSVNLNGSIFLQARDSAAPLLARDADGNDVFIPVGTRTGSVALGGNSLTEVATETGDASRIRDDAVFNPSQTAIVGKTIALADAALGEAGARIVAPGGAVSLAAQGGQSFNAGSAPTDGARVYLGKGARIDVSGHRNVARAVTDDVIEVDLRGEVLADAPLQRDPAYGRALYGKKIWVDMREGTPLGNVAGYKAGLERTAAEKNAVGGTVELKSEGDVLMHRAAGVDVSGGSVAYQGGVVPVSYLLYRAGGAVMAAEASPDRLYSGVVNGLRREPGYVEGRDAGSLRVLGYKVALDGELRGEAVSGPRQRTPGKAPRGGALIVGHDAGVFMTPDVLLGRYRPGRNLEFSAAAPDRLELSTEFMEQGGFTRFTLNSDGAVVLQSDAALSSRAGGEVKIKAREVDVQGRIALPGGTVKLETVAVAGDSGLDPADHDIRIGAGARINTAGRWINDIGRGLPDDATAIDGGSITLASQSDLALARGAVLDVSAGAWWQSAGKLKLGKAGTMTLKSGGFNAGGGAWSSTLDLGGELRGYGLVYGTQVSAGGTLSLATSRVRIDGLASTAGAGGLLTLNTGFFDLGGFAGFTVNGNDGVRLTAGSVLHPQPLTRQIERSDVLAPHGSDTAAITSAVRLPWQWRAGTAVSLAADSIVSGDVAVEAGARVEVDPDGAVALRGEHRIDVAGTLRAPGGSVRLSQSGHDNIESYDPTRAIHLAATARVDADGVVKPNPHSPYREGEVLQGGSIEMNAARGYLIAQEGSRLSADGASGTLDLPGGAGGRGRVAIRVDSEGGRIALSARDGLLIDATLSARGGGDAAGGSLEAGLRLDEVWSAPSGDPVNAARRLMLSQDEAAGTAGVTAGAAVPDSLIGIGRLAANRVAAGGFADLRLFVANRKTPEGNRIELTEDVSLAVPRRLTFDAPNLLATGGASGAFSAAAWEITNSLAAAQYGDSLLPVGAGSGSLSFTGRLGEVTGNVAIGGFATTRLAASTDLRLNGVVHDVDLYPGVEDYRLRGSLITGGDLDLAAAQVYPSTLTEFAIEIHDKADGRVRILPNGAPGAALSAGGRLRISAPHIEQHGVLRAPFGELELASETVARSGPFTATRTPAPGGSVTLAPGSLTSVSGEGMTIPFGTTELGGRNWIYNLSGGRIAFEAPPQKAVALKADRVDVAAGAKVDLSGGGELAAWEFVAGPNGSGDVLAAPGSYAVLPGLRLDQAPRDVQNWSASGLAAGDALVLTAAAGGLPAGAYVLLPARYALLPGAYLVSLQSGGRDMPAGSALTRQDGTVQVAVRTATTLADGSLTQADRTRAALVMNGAQVRLRSEYIERTASEHFAAAGSLQRAGDAGRLQLQASSALGLDGELLARHGAGFLGARVDLTAENLQVTADGAAADAGFVGVGVGTLNRLGAESLLLGAVREETADGVVLRNDAGNFVAKRLVIDSGAGAALAAPEVIAVAGDTLQVASGARIEAQGDSAAPATTLRLAGDGALLRVANGAQHEVVRSGVTRAQGMLDVAAGARLAGRSVILDATRDNRNAGEIDLPAAGGALAVSAGRISAGETAGVSEGLVFSNAQLAALGNPAALRLKSYSTLDLYGAVNLGGAGMGSLQIEAGGIAGSANSGATALLLAREVRIGNADGTAFAPAAAPSTGTLRIEADTVRLGAGTVDYAGFSGLQVQAAREMVTAGAGRHAVAGTLDIAAARITAAPASDQRVVASGALTTTALPVPADLAAPPAGGALALEGARIAHAGNIDLPSGRIMLSATGATAGDGVDLLAGSRVAATGFAKDFDGSVAAAPAGSVLLESAHGNVAVRAGALVDVSGTAGSDAGSLTARAPEGAVILDGMLRAAALPGAAGGAPAQGRLALDARTLPTLDALAAASEFQGRLDFRQRLGDLALSAGETLKAHDIRLAADAGSLTIGGTLDASGARGGSVALYARPGAGGGDVVLAGGAVIDASATAPVDNAVGTAGRGGVVLIEASPDDAGNAGRVRVQAGSTIRLGAAAGSSAADGRLVLRAKRAGGGVNIDPIAGAIDGAREVVAEGTQVYAAAVPNFAQAHADNQAFMANAAAIRAALGFPGDSAYRVRPHVEYRSSGDFTLSSDTSLAAYRYGGEAATLTLRAAGSLRLDGSLSDGFSTATTSGLLNDLPAQSWSYRLTAGADTTAAASAAVRPLGELEAADTGDFRLAANKLVRTGTGNIAVVAGRDVRLANDGSVIYAAGADDPTVSGDDFFVATNIGSRRGEFPTGGGDVRLAAGRDVVGGGGTQLINDWLYRMGSAVNDDGSLKPLSSTVRRVAWWPRFDLFKQGIGAFGGGDTSVEAGRHVSNLGVVAPTNGRLPGAAGSVPTWADLKLQGGGDVAVRAGGDVLGGVYYAGAGDIRVDAGGSIGSARNNTDSVPKPVYPVVALGDGSARLIARQNATLETVLNPTLIEQASANRALGRTSYFSTYGAGNGVALLSVSGDATLQNAAGKTNSGFTFATGTGEARFYPGRVEVAALEGDVSVAAGMTLAPDAAGELALLAQGSVTVGGTIKMGDADPDSLPSPLRPITATSNDNWSNNILRVGALGTRAHDPDLLAARSARPVRLAALSGDIRHPGSNVPMLDVPKSVRMKAGGDILDATVSNQHLSDADVTRLEAGGDIVFDTITVEAPGGGQEAQRYGHGVVTGGGGRVELIADGSIGLGSSSGVVTRGNFDNPYLPEGGASIFVQAGAARADYAALLAYLRDPARAALRAEGGIATGLARYEAALTAFMRARSGDPGMTPDDARAAFALLGSTERDAFYAEQRPLLLDLVFAAIGAAGSSGVRGGSFQPGYDVLAALFPEKAGHSGSLDLFYSQLRTEQGGGIRMLVPHGDVNVGLNTPGSAKEVARQGIFSIAGAGSDIEAAVGRDFAVNRSRVFTLGGSDIMIWSSYGNIDAGKGAKTAAATPPAQGRLVGDLFVVDISAAVTGSGIGTLKGRPDTPNGNVRLYAPAGYVDAGDAGIRAGGDIEIGGGFRGADNIQAGGSVSGVAVEAPAAAPAPTPAAPLAESAGGGERAAESAAEQARNAAPSLFTVEVIGLGDEEEDERKKRN